MHKLSMLWLLLLLGLGGCTNVPGTRAMPDGTLEIECESDVSYCVRHAESFCGNKPLEVLDATSREGPQGDARHADGSRITIVRFVCGRNEAINFHLHKKHPEIPAPPEASATPQPTTPAPVCAAGATQECIGPGACAGGQSCLPDGSGWGACDCGTATPPTPAPEPSSKPAHTADPES